MNFKETAPKIIEYLGGKENIKTHTHCMTRLRFVLNDDAKADEEALKALKGVKGIVKQGGMFQVIIGVEVEQLYNEILPLLPDAEAAPVVEDLNADDKKESKMNQIFAFISGCITPTLPVLIGSGLISAILALLLNFNVLTNESSTYILLNALANAAYSYLPVMVAFAGARRLKTNEYVAAFIMLALCSAAVTGVEGLSIFGIPLMSVKYTSNIVPALLMVPVMSVLDKAILKVTPNAIKSIIRPFALAMIMFPITLLVLGPIGTIVGSALAQFCIWVTSFGGLSMAILSALHPLLVMVGMHTIITPLIVNEITAVGSSLLFSKALAANLAIAGAALAVGIKAKKAENKEVGISTGITALLSVTEPALYGVLIRMKKPLISAIIASAITGVFIGIFDIRAYATASCSFLTLPIFMGGSMSNFYLACAAAVMATVLGFVITWIIGFDED
ncbi:PTS transporter subunit EIIC [Dielma fastidiosa]|uniref:PTS system beta-glucosides-specific IIC component n=2 Tax=Dielma fastidiosa TaxID=1034346 RepID=A0A318KSR6_9FIRM|nr:PTS transporter subunit EIIC [Dielma fastidiosa]PXX80914.1 PTS system beta-glucosides-specific IIC component [Dielma fastidiosa]